VFITVHIVAGTNPYYGMAFAFLRESTNENKALSSSKPAGPPLRMAFFFASYLRGIMIGYTKAPLALWPTWLFSISVVPSPGNRNLKSRHRTPTLIVNERAVTVSYRGNGLLNRGRRLNSRDFALMIPGARVVLSLALAAGHANPFVVDALVTMRAMTDAAFLDR
jgi:hypothetical protein